MFFIFIFIIFFAPPPPPGKMRTKWTLFNAIMAELYRSLSKDKFPFSWVISSYGQWSIFLNLNLKIDPSMCVFHWGRLWKIIVGWGSLLSYYRWSSGKFWSLFPDKTKANCERMRLEAPLGSTFEFTFSIHARARARVCVYVNYIFYCRINEKANRKKKRKKKP